MNPTKVLAAIRAQYPETHSMLLEEAIAFVREDRRIKEEWNHSLDQAGNEVDRAYAEWRG